MRLVRVASESDHPSRIRVLSEGDSRGRSESHPCKQQCGHQPGRAGQREGGAVKWGRTREREREMYTAGHACACACARMNRI